MHQLKSFFYGQVTVKIFDMETLERDADLYAIIRQIKTDTGLNDGNFGYEFAQRISYTDEMSFNWHPSVPPQYKTLETLWEMLKSGVPVAECYAYSRKEVPQFLSAEWQNAVDAAHKIWTPPEEKGDEAEMAQDPN